MSALNIDIKRLLSNGVSSLNGIAGCGKTTTVNVILTQLNVPFIWGSATRRLAEDMRFRFNIDAKTIASAFFNNDDGRFYTSEKDDIPENTVLIFDEILLTNPRVIDFINHHKDTNPIIMMTDDAQCSSPDGDTLANLYHELCNDPSTYNVYFDYSYRAEDDDTQALYHYFRDRSIKHDFIPVHELEQYFPVLNLDDITYTPDDVYATPFDDIENYLYLYFDLQNRSDVPRIMKGRRSKDNIKHPENYPLLSQKSAEQTHALFYAQAANLGSVFRLQGTQIEHPNTLYLIVDPTSFVSASVIYTAISRPVNKDMIKLVYCAPDAVKPLKTFNNKPVKLHRIYTMSTPTGDVKLKKGMFAVTPQTNYLSPDKMEQVCSAFDDEDIYYDRSLVLGSNGVPYYITKDEATRRLHGDQEIIEFDENNHITHYAITNRKQSLNSILKRDSQLHLSYVPQLYSILDKFNVNAIRAPRLASEGDRFALPLQLDLKSAYYCAFNFEKMPSDGLIKTSYDKTMLNFYLYNGDYMTDNSVITEPLADYINSHNLGSTTYLFSTPYATSTYAGRTLYNMVTSDKDLKAKAKSIAHWGYMEKHYLEEHKDCYSCHDNFTYELTFATIVSNLDLYILSIADIVNSKTFLVDAVFFECYNDDIEKKIRAALPSYIDYRIMVGNDKSDTVYQTYEELKSHEEVLKERKRMRDKLRRQNMTEEQKNKERERKRLYMQKKRKEQIQNG